MKRLLMIYRRKVYMRLIEKIMKPPYIDDSEGFYLCHYIRMATLWGFTISKYEELWNRKPEDRDCSRVWFRTNAERLKFLQEAVLIINEKLMK